MKWLIPYSGETYTFDDSRLTASEARLQKRITGGITPFAAEQARMQLDPDAWVGALVIARRRSGLDADAAMDVDADEIDLMAAMRATTEAGNAAVAEALAKQAAAAEAAAAEAAA